VVRPARAWPRPAVRRAGRRGAATKAPASEALAHPDRTGHDARMGELSGEARDRVRAMSLWLVTGIVLAGVAVGLYAVIVGFDRVEPAAVARVAPAAEQRDLIVEYVGGSPGCGDPHRVQVTESDDEVVVSATVVVRHGTRFNAACDDEGISMVQTVRLAAPLGGRFVRDASRPDVTVPVVADLAELAHAG
jgi:hypothetical protein